MADDKKRKREAKELWEKAEKVFEYGDFATASKLARRVGEIAPDTDQGRAALQRVEMLKVDPGGLYALAGAGLLYVLAWVYALA